MKFIDDEGFEYSQLEAFFLPQNFFEESEIEYLQLRWPCLGGSRFENGTKRALGPTGLVSSSDSLYPWIDKGDNGPWELEPRVCILLSNAIKSWKPPQWLEVLHHEFCNKSQPESSFERSKLQDSIGQNPRSANSKCHLWHNRRH